MLKNRLLCLGIMISTLLFAIFYGGSLPYALLYTTAALILFSLLYLLTVRLLCKATHFTDRIDLYKGEDVTLTTVIHNRSPLFVPYATITYKKVAGISYNSPRHAITVSAFSRSPVPLRLTAKCRGRYSVNIDDVHYLDFLGIVRLRAKIPPLRDITVYPRVIPLGNLTLDGKFDTDNQMNPDRIAEDVSSVSDVREYMYGDSMRRIHWNLSARTSTYMSKNYENITKSRLTLLLDLSPVTVSNMPVPPTDDTPKQGEKRNRHKRRVSGSQSAADALIFGAENRLILEDMVIECALSIAYHFLNISWNVALHYYCGEYYTGNLTDVGMFGAIYEHLTFAEFNSIFDMVHILDNVYITDVGEHLNLCIVTHTMTDSLWEHISLHAEQGSRISIIYICANKEALEAANWVTALRQTSVSLHIYCPTDSLTDILGRV